MTKQNEKQAPKAPTMRAFQVRESNKKGGKGFWTAVGAAWAHEDGKGFNIQLSAMPLDGKIVLRTIEDKPDSDTDE